MHINGKALIAITTGSLAAMSSFAAADNAEFDAAVLESLPGIGSAPPVLGSNMEGGSVFDNYVQARENGQFFLHRESSNQYEMPASKLAHWSVVLWCGNLELTGVNATDPVVGYTAQCVRAALGDSVNNAEAAGGAVSTGYSVFGHATSSLSAVFVPQTNVFEGTSHSNDDNFLYRFWDDGRSTMSGIGWELHDEGDFLHPNAATSSFSSAAKLSWISAEEAASLINLDASDLTSELFGRVYEEAWATDVAHGATLEDIEAPKENSEDP